MKKYKVSGRSDEFNNGRWLYLGQKTLQDVEILKITHRYTQYKLTDLESGEQKIINR